MPASRGRWLAIDWGERRIGLAISDPTGTLATPAGVILRRAGKRPPIAEVMRRATDLEAVAFVMGLPLDGNGNDTPRATECRVVAAALQERTGLPTALVDERYTTAAALRGIREAGSSKRERAADIDAMAAAVLLQHAMRLHELNNITSVDEDET